MNNRISRRFFAIVCILLVLAYASALLLPHSHESGSEDCAVCSFIKSSSGIVAAVGSCFILAMQAGASHGVLDIFRNALILHNSAPVWLKVKLSD